ncbi:MAG: ribulose-phosphate 3-epimerase [Ignavibacteria bacterium]|nr:ribulose-phosphate 3-epimerase [Ignavibacteria bacterium]
MKGLYTSILSANFSNLESEIKLVESAGVQGIHCDIMDGHFVPNISYGPMVVSAVNKITELPLDVHLMIDNCDLFIKEFANAGADYISVHFENNIHLHRTISLIKSFNLKAGVAINPSTTITNIIEILPFVDYVLIMSVNPGYGGQKFIESSLEKIKALRRLIIKNKYNCHIQVDGGIDASNIRVIKNAGADMFVAGASIYRAKDKIKATKLILKEISKK